MLSSLTHILSSLTHILPAELCVVSLCCRWAHLWRGELEVRSAGQCLCCVSVTALSRAPYMASSPAPSSHPTHCRCKLFFWALHRALGRARWDLLISDNYGLPPTLSSNPMDLNRPKTDRPGPGDLVMWPGPDGENNAIMCGYRAGRGAEGGTD